MKVLNIVSSAYRATLEEQDDTIVWLTHALKGAGADIAVLLRGAAVNYVVEGQEVLPLVIGARAQKCAPDVFGQVRALMEKGVSVFVLEEDLAARGLAKAPRLAGAALASRKLLADLMARHDQVWHW
jgi:sulfur transfer complex TusBCD TusB component (DsrH family)